MLSILFLGSSAFAVPILQKLHGSGRMHVDAVVTRPDAPAGRGRKPACTPVAAEAERLGIPLAKPARLEPGCLNTSGISIMVSAAYGAWLPEWLLGSVPLGVVNVHPSLLPDFRGAAPVARSILAGLGETGVSFMLTDTGWDTGPVIHSSRTPIAPGETAGELTARLSLMAAAMAPDVLARYASGELRPVPQKGTGTYAEKLTRDDARLNWELSAVELERAVRAFNPVPGAWTLFNGRVLKVHRGAVVAGCGLPGTFVLPGDGRLLAAAGNGMLDILEVQPESGRRMDTPTFLRGLRPCRGKE